MLLAGLGSGLKMLPSACGLGQLFQETDKKDSAVPAASGSIFKTSVTVFPYMDLLAGQ